MSRVQTHGIILIVLLAVMAGVSFKYAPVEAQGKPVDMGAWIPMEFEGWRGEQYDPPEVWQAQLPAARFMVRYYQSKGTMIEFLMIESPDPGSFHSPMFCLPGSGWTPKEAGVQKLADGEVSKAEFVMDFDTLTVRYWYLSGDKLCATLWGHKWNMLMNKLRGVTGPNFSFRITVRRAGTRVPADAADEFANDAIRQIRNHLLELKGKGQASQ